MTENEIVARTCSWWRSAPIGRGCTTGSPRWCAGSEPMGWGWGIKEEKQEKQEENDQTGGRGSIGLWLDGKAWDLPAGWRRCTLEFQSWAKSDQCRDGWPPTVPAVSKKSGIENSNNNDERIQTQIASVIKHQSHITNPSTNNQSSINHPSMACISPTHLGAQCVLGAADELLDAPHHLALVGRVLGALAHHARRQLAARTDEATNINIKMSEKAKFTSKMGIGEVQVQYLEVVLGTGNWMRMLPP